MGIVKWFKRFCIEDDLNTLRRRLNKGLINADEFCRKATELHKKREAL